jgi:hypothetical protein
MFEAALPPSPEAAVTTGTVCLGGLRARQVALRPFVTEGPRQVVALHHAAPRRPRRRRAGALRCGGGPQA